MVDTRAKAVSRVKNELSFLDKDSYYSDRAILFMLEDKLKFLISQKLGDKNSLYRENIYSRLKCFDLEKINSVNCGIVEFSMCKTLMKSTNKIPETVDSKYFNDILNVVSIDGGQLFTPLTVREYAQKDKRRYSIARHLYFVRDGYLYIPDYEVYAVDLDILTLRVEELADKSSCSKEDCCKSYWDYPLITSDKLTESAINGVVQELISTFKQIPKDENPNLDSNIKSQTNV